MTRTRLAIALSRPGLLAQGSAAQPTSGLVFDFEDDHGPGATCNELSAGAIHGTHHGTEHLAGRAGATEIGWQRGVPDPPLLAIERGEGAGVGTRQRAHEVVDHARGTVPADASVGGAPARANRVRPLRVWAPAALPRPGRRPRH